MPIDPHLIPGTLDLFHLVLAAATLILLLLVVVIIFLPRAPRPQKDLPIETDGARPLSPTSTLTASNSASALQLLGLLQQEARFIDFIEEDLQAHGDAEIGAAARVVHEGCRRVMHQHITLEPVVRDEEGASMTLEKGFNASEIRIVGNVTGVPPFRGRLVHKGWKVGDIRLPLMSDAHDPHVLAPAEVEL